MENQHAMIYCTTASCPCLAALITSKLLPSGKLSIIDFFQAMANKEWDKAVELRGKSFVRNLETYKMLTRLQPPAGSFDAEGKGKVCNVMLGKEN